MSIVTLSVESSAVGRKSQSILSILTPFRRQSVSCQIDTNTHLAARRHRKTTSNPTNTMYTDNKPFNEPKLIRNDSAFCIKIFSHIFFFTGSLLPLLFYWQLQLAIASLTERSIRSWRRTSIENIHWNMSWSMKKGELAGKLQRGWNQKCQPISFANCLLNNIPSVGKKCVYSQCQEHLRLAFFF